MNILFVGDIFASPGRRIVADHLRDIVATNAIDLVIANARKLRRRLWHHAGHR